MRRLRRIYFNYFAIQGNEYGLCTSQIICTLRKNSDREKTPNAFGFNDIVFVQ